MAIRPFSFSNTYKTGGGIIKVWPSVGLEMLAHNCDLDDMENLQKVVNLFEKLSLINSTLICRYSDNNNDYIPYYKGQ